ncbi:MAG: Hsp20/alpha crystallin family protein [Bacteroidia bacterium]
MTLIKWKKPSEDGLSNNPMIYQSPFQGLMENFFNDNFFRREYASFVPAINISEETDKFNLELSAPGFEKNDFKIELNKGVLSVSGEHKAEKENTEKNFTRKEFNYGSFQRSFTLPEEVNEELIDAKYENGILKLTLPKKEEKIKNSREIRVA